MPHVPMLIERTMAVVKEKLCLPHIVRPQSTKGPIVQIEKPSKETLEKTEFSRFGGKKDEQV